MTICSHCVLERPLVVLAVEASGIIGGMTLSSFLFTGP